MKTVVLEEVKSDVYPLSANAAEEAVMDLSLSAHLTYPQADTGHSPPHASEAPSSYLSPGCDLDSGSSHGYLFCDQTSSHHAIVISTVCASDGGSCCDYHACSRLIVPGASGVYDLGRVLSRVSEICPEESRIVVLCDGRGFGSVYC